MGHWLPLFDSNAASGYLGATYLCWGPGAPVRDVSLIIETVSPGWSIIDGKRVEAAKSGEVEVTVEVDAAPVKR